MYDSYTKFQVKILEIQLMLAGAELSDYDRQQNRVRSADGKWAKSSSVMSDEEKLLISLDTQKDSKADTPERRKAITMIAKKLAGATDPVAQAWGKISGSETAYRRKIIEKLVPAIAVSGKNLDGIDIDERERAISDLDEELQKVLPREEANKLITELILDTKDYEHKEMLLDAKDRATSSLEQALSDASMLEPPKKQVVDIFVKAVDDIVNTATQKDMTGEEFLAHSAKKLIQDDARQEQLKRIGRNTQRFMDDIATVALASFRASKENFQNLSRADSTPRTQDSKESANKSLDQKASNTGTKDSQEDFNKNLSQTVSSFFSKNIEAYYEGRSKAGEEKHKKIKEILDKAKVKVNNVEK